jgi:hypothetical protein
MLFAGLAVAEYRMAPHMQPPWMSSANLHTPFESRAYLDGGSSFYMDGASAPLIVGASPKKERRSRGAPERGNGGLVPQLSVCDSR